MNQGFVFNFLYYFALVYLGIAGVIYLITMLIILLDKKKSYFNHLAAMSSPRWVRILVGIGSPIILAVGWIFLFPFTSGKED